MSQRTLLRPMQSGFDPRSISGLALWLDAADSGTLYTTDAGPVTPVSSPLDIAGCGLWLDASNTGSLTLNGDTVSEWRDLSGNGRHFSQATAAAQPNAVARTQNGRRVLDFGGAQEMLGNAASLNILRNVGGATIMAAVQWDVVDTSTRIAFRAAVSTSNTSRAALLTGQFPNQMSVVGRRLDADASSSASGVVAAGSYVATGIIDYANTDGFLYSNGSTLGQNLSFLTAGNTDDTNSTLVNVGVSGFDGWVGEIIVWPRVLTATERARAEAYLAAKWGISGVHAPATATNDPVGAWLDKSGNGRHATQATVANRPTRQLAVRNGRGTMRWDGTNDSYRVASIPLDATISVFVAAQFNVAGAASNATGNLFIEHSPNVNTNSGWTFAGSDNAPLVVNRTAAPTFRRAILGVTNWLGTSWAIAEGRIAAAANMVAAADYWRNGGLQSDGGEITSGGFGNGTITSGRSVTADLFIGSRNQASVFSNGDYAEILIYNRPLSDSEHQRVRRYLAAKWGITLYSPPTYADADVNAYISAVEIADGAVALEPGVRNAINDFITGCKADGIWSAIKASCILAGARTLAGALVPLVGAAPTNNGPFVSGDYDRKTGLVGNGTTKYLDTGRAGNADPQDNIHMAVYLNTLHTLTVSGVYIGHGSTGNGATNLLRNSTLGPHGSRCRNASGSSHLATAVGLFGVSRSGSSSYTARTGGTDYTVSIASQTATSDSVFVFTRNNGTGGTFGPVNARMTFYSLGESLSLSQLESRLATYLTAIGAAIP